LNETLTVNQEINKKLANLLRPDGNIVAVKLYDNREQLDLLCNIKQADGRFAFCQIISQSWYLARSRLVLKDQQLCYGAERALGLSSKGESVHKSYVGWQFKTEKAAYKAFQCIPMFEAESRVAIYVSPLDMCIVQPDVLLFFGNASQMLVILSAYLAERGGTFTMESNNQNTCAGIIVGPIKENRPTIVIPGNALRVLAFPNVNDLACGIPWSSVKELIENMQFLKTMGGSRYPPAWQHIKWGLQPPILDLIAKEDDPNLWFQK
jgi:uncharacterized protein (DUF169 family)